MIQELLYIGSLTTTPEAYHWMHAAAITRNRECGADEGLATLRRGPSRDEWTLMVALPGGNTDKVIPLAKALLETQSRDSRDLTHRAAVYVLRTGEAAVHINGFMLHQHFPAFCFPATLNVAMVSDDKLVVVRHRLSKAEVESLEAEAQAAFATSGLNYKPYRAWGEKAMEAVAGLEDEPEPGVIHCTVRPIAR